MSEWMPIESAPLDKNMLLWWVPKTPNKFAETCVIGLISSSNEGFWWNPISARYQELVHITHWMPMPKPPAD